MIDSELSAVGKAVCQRRWQGEGRVRSVQVVIRDELKDV